MTTAECGGPKLGGGRGNGRDTPEDERSGLFDPDEEFGWDPDQQTSDDEWAYEEPDDDEEA